LEVSPATLKTYLEILKALFIVFTIHPWYRNVGRAMLQMPKIYFFDTGLVRGDQGVRLENAVAGMLLKQRDFLRDSRGVDAGLYYIRTKDGAEVDFALSEGESITQLIECKLSDETPHKALTRFAAQFSQAQAVQIVGNLRQEELVQGIQVTDAARWLAQLEV
jgi:predicted AAA+ superfamily ATPase